MTLRRTYWHLEGRNRLPSDYEIATTGLLYYPARGIGVRTEGADWIERHQMRGRLRCADWDRFADPRATTYASYVELQQQRVIYMDGVLAAGDSGELDLHLSEAWLACCGEIVAPLRYPAHGLQMASAYVASLAPSGRIAAALAFQSADALRVVQALAYRLAQLRKAHPGIARPAKHHWQTAPGWQPWRRLIETLLVAYDWDEALLALHVVVKPAFDELFLALLAQVAARHDDDLTRRLLASLWDDALWQRECTRQFVRLCAAEDEGNLGVARALAGRWVARAFEAIDACADGIDAVDGLPAGTGAAAARAALAGYWDWLGVGTLAAAVGEQG